MIDDVGTPPLRVLRLEDSDHDHELEMVHLRRAGLRVPITGAVFILVPVAAHFSWGEALPPMRVLGILIIILGIFLVARGAAP